MFSTDAFGQVRDVPLASLVEGTGPQHVATIENPYHHHLPIFVGPGASGVRACAMAAVLRACAAQVSRETLASFGVDRAEDLTMLQLAMAHKSSDTGMLGDVFEYAVADAVNNGDPQVLELLSGALLWIKESPDIVRAVPAGAEGGKARASAALLPEGTTMRTGRRGRPPSAERLLRTATTTEWKNDLLLVTSNGGAVGVTLKSNPRDMARHLRACQGLLHAPRIGVIPVMHKLTGVTPDATGVPVVCLSTQMSSLWLLQSTLTTVQTAFARSLKPGSTPLSDPEGVNALLYQLRHRTLSQALDSFDEESRRFHGHLLVTPAASVASEQNWETREGGDGALVAVKVLDRARQDPIADKDIASMRLRGLGQTRQRDLRDQQGD